MYIPIDTGVEHAGSSPSLSPSCVAPFFFSFLRAFPPAAAEKRFSFLVPTALIDVTDREREREDKARRL